MKYLGDNTLARTALSLLAVGIMSFGVLSIITMNHEMNMTSTGSMVSQSSNCSDSHDAQSCLDYHLGIMHNLSTATHGNLDLQLISLLLFSFVGLLALALFKLLEYGYTRQRIRLRQLYEKTITAFALQLGNWLTLFEKRDPSYAFVLA
jgi:Tfp pilus assembly protein PilV